MAALPLGSTVLFQFINLAKAMLEQSWPWMLLRRTGSSKTVAASSTSAWQTAIDLSTITNFSRFYETPNSTPIKLFDGVNSIEQYRQVPCNERLYYKDVPNTFVFDEGTKQLYLNGSVSFAGTLYIDHIIDSPDLTNDSTSSWIFPTWSHSLLGFYAIGLYKGGVDYDDINARLAPDNRAQAAQIMQMLSKLDNEKQLAALTNIDPSNGPGPGGHRDGAVNMN